MAPRIGFGPSGIICSRYRQHCSTTVVADRWSARQHRGKGWEGKWRAPDTGGEPGLSGSFGGTSGTGGKTASPSP